MARHVRKGDEVIVLSGADKGKRGKILRVMPAEDRVIVEGVNVRIKHRKPRREGEQGGRITMELPIHISKVSPIADGKPTRVRFETREDGSKVRVAVRTGEVLGAPLKKAKS